MPTSSALRVFISHSSKDEQLAHDIAGLISRALRLDDGEILCTAVAGHRLAGGVLINEALRRKVHDADVMVAILSPHALDSIWVMFEVGGRWATGRTLKVLTTPGLSADDVRGPLHDLTCFTFDRPGIGQMLVEIGEAIDKRVELTPGILGRFDQLMDRWARAPEPPHPEEEVTASSGLVAALEAGFREFEQAARSRVSDECLRECLITARKAMHDVARLFDRKWQRGAHVAEGLDAKGIYTVDRQEYAPMCDDVVKAVTRRLIDVRQGLICPILADDRGEVPLYPQKAGNAEYKWVIDSIDGSRHVLRHLPLFATTITLVDAAFAPVLSLTYVPVTGELFFALRDLGAYLNDWNTRLPLPNLHSDKRLRPFIHMEFPNWNTQAVNEAEFDQLCLAANQVFAFAHRVRGLGLGSLGLAYTAKGTFDAYVTFASGTSKFDILAGELLIRETKGEVRTEQLQHSRHDDPGNIHVRMIAGRSEVVNDLLNLTHVRPLFRMSS